MQQEFVKVFKPFVDFLKAFESHQVHNMLALMLDFHFKILMDYGKLCGILEMQFVSLLNMI